MPARKVGAMYISQVNRKVTPLDNVLTVDSGFNTGWAFWTKENGPQEPAEYGQITLPRSKKWDTEDQLVFMWTHFSDLLSKLSLKYGMPRTVVLEGVESWQHSEHSRASTYSGDLFKLAYLVGGYACTAKVFSAEVSIIMAREWKGQLDKDATRYRVALVTGTHYRTEHITDAIGMGLSIMGIL